MTLASTEGVSLGVKAAEKRHRKKNNDGITINLKSSIFFLSLII
tara:strand:+ start:83 stop:214 length:132 start_codon:yes stop_codon:yes gene_type:complete